MTLSASIALCTYNGARFLPAQWASLLAQSRLPDEIVVRDDASSDATPALLDELAAAARARGIAVRLIRGDHNLGYIRNFEAALAAATGDVVFLCDQDDVWHPHKLAAQLAVFAARPELCALCTDARRVDAGLQPLRHSLFETLRVTAGEWRRIHAGCGFDVLLRRSLASGATLACRRGLLDTALPIAPGWAHDEWLAIMAAAIGGFDGLSFPLLDYRQHPGNQIGMPERGPWQRLRSLGEPQGPWLAARIARTQALLARLQALATQVPAARKLRVQQALAHWRGRAAMGAGRRIGPVLRIAGRGNYSRFDHGWRTALRDLLRRDAAPPVRGPVSWAFPGRAATRRDPSCHQPGVEMVVDSVLELIGHTPMLRVKRLDTGPCELFLKLESANPGGSIKDRIGMSMIEGAEKAGRIKPGATLVEGTAGNTGLGLALVAQAKGYKLILVVPDKMSREKIFNLKAMGAEVVLTRSDVAKGHPEYYQDLAASIAEKTPGAYFINQFGNPDNPAAHESTTGPEILAQMDGRVDALVVGCGSSGTLAGLSHYFAKASPATEFILADPVGSVLAEYINTGNLTKKSASWMVEGIGEDFLPVISDFTRVRHAYSISDQESFLTARELLAKEGVLGGSSTGTLLAAALRYCRAQTAPRRVVSLVCDTGNKYLSKLYNDYWMLDNGFLERQPTGDLRDLIMRPYAQRDTVVVKPDDMLVTAYNRMKLYDVSQLPVMDGERLVGIIDESDLLVHVYGDEAKFRDPVSAAMITQLQTLGVKAPVADLLAIFAHGRVAIVMDGEHFLGLITRIDLLNYLRRRVA